MRTLPFLFFSQLKRTRIRYPLLPVIHDRNIHVLPQSNSQILQPNPNQIPKSELAPESESEASMNEFISRFVHSIRPILSQSFQGLNKQTLDSMLLRICQRVIAKIDQSDQQVDVDLSEDLWKTIRDVSKQVRESMRRDRMREELRKYLHHEDVKEMCRSAGDAEMPMLAEEYSKAITLAGRSKNVDLSVGLFCDAAETYGIRSTCIYNALMAAYMCNGYTKKAISVFEDLQKDPDCNPTIATYNILLSVFGRSMLVNHMESTLKIIDESDDLSPDISTYNTVIAGYITAWMWDRMETTFQRMKAGPIKPAASTYLLMLRGYAHSGNIGRMEETYELVKEMVGNQEIYLIRAMICAYCKSSDPDRVRKIENLMKLVPDEEYRSWLNVILIRVYAQEGLVESMDRFILEAFKRSTMVMTSGIMRSIISGYFKCDAVDRLAGFIRHAEHAGWRLCRSLYHCKMVLYGQHNRLEEMHTVLNEMEVNKFYPTKKTFLIMFKAYWKAGRKYEAESICGIMWKHGFCTPESSIDL